jgi:hypothetical protein
MSASRAALTIRHLRDRDWIILVYSGTREQISGSGLSQEGEEFIYWPSGTRVPTKLPLHKLSPHRFQMIGSIFKINEERYALQIKEALPREISTVGDGIECFDFSEGTNWGYVAYVGEKDKLISEGIAKTHMFPDDSTEEGRQSDGWENTVPNTSGYGYYRLEETIRLHAGKWAYVNYPQAIKEAEEAGRELSSFRTPDEYRQSLSEKVNAARTVIDLAPVEAKTGQIYSIDAESKEAIEDSWRELYRAIRDAVIYTRMAPIKLSEEEKAMKREQYMGAQSDAAFKAFVQGLIGHQDSH